MIEYLSRERNNDSRPRALLSPANQGGMRSLTPIFAIPPKLPPPQPISEDQRAAREAFGLYGRKVPPLTTKFNTVHGRVPEIGLLTSNEVVLEGTASKCLLREFYTIFKSRRPSHQRER